MKTRKYVFPENLLACMAYDRKKREENFSKMVNKALNKGKVSNTYNWVDAAFENAELELI
jgi:hypothetical protein